jgi:hypothetical protein
MSLKRKVQANTNARTASGKGTGPRRTPGRRPARPATPVAANEVRVVDVVGPENQPRNPQACIDNLIEQAEYKQHPYGKVWQQFDQEAFAELVDNIDRRGLDKEITRYQGMILEGWHRYLACLATKVTPKFVEFKGTELDAAELVHASGIRRQSSADQRYASFLLLCDACPAFKAKYEQLQEKGELQQKEGKPLATGGQRVDVVKAKADFVRVSKTTAKKVERVKKVKPEAVAEIAAGGTSANKVLKKLADKGRKQGGNGNGKPAATRKNDKPPKDQGEKKAPLLTCAVQLELRTAKGKSVHDIKSVLFLGKAEFKGLYVWHKNAKAVPLAPGAPLPKGCLAEVMAIRSAHGFKVEEGDPPATAPAAERSKPPAKPTKGNNNRQEA